ncbi:MAG: acetylornithine deacetylase [Chloroflexi bacterium]|nr:MAG: acetylornithine deacetylase [Chloroflexota bacterium]
MSEGLAWWRRRSFLTIQSALAQLGCDGCVCRAPSPTGKCRTVIVATRAELIATLSDLVAINSINPGLVAGAPGEGALALAIAERLRRTPGIEVELQEVEPGRPNVIATVRGGPGRTLLLNGHTDTVGVAGMDAPFTARIEGDRLYARGASDMKDGLTAMIHVLEAAARSGDFPGTLVGTFVLDEEYASIGTQAICDVIERWQPHGALVLEGTNLEMTVAHKGYFAAEIETRGRAVHGSDYAAGIDAICYMGRVLVELEQLGNDYLTREPHPMLGPSSIHASLISGGRELNSYPDRCTLQLEARTATGHSAEQVLAELQAMLDRLAAADPTFTGEVRLLFARDPLNVPLDAEIVRTVSAVVERERGRPPKHKGGSGWTDTALFTAVGVPAVLFGPHGEGAHSLDEWADLAVLEQFTRVLYSVAVEFCGGSA